MKQFVRQKFHLEPNIGLLNDPNGLVQYKGLYYVFFQWNRFEKNHTYKEWGLFTSKNLIDWNFKGSAIIPDQEYDLNGVYSGSSYVINDKLYIFYTGNRKYENRRKSSQCLVISKNGRNFLKKGIIINTPTKYSEHFRDPKIFKGKEKDYFIVVGAQTAETKQGAIVLYRSPEGENWRYISELAISQKYQMVECPDLFSIENKYILLYCLQHRDNEKDIPLKSFAVYKIVDLDEATGRLDDNNLDENYFMMDYGFDFYAPQTFKDDRNRRILWAWMSRMNDDEEEAFAKLQDSIHCLTIPREILIKNGRLYQKPIEELYRLLAEKIEIEKQSDGQFDIVNDRHSMYLKLKDIASGQDIDWTVKDEIKINYSYKKKEFALYRLNWLTNNWDKKSCDLESLMDLEIWIDNASIEIFINAGEKVFSSRIYPKHQGISISGNLCGDLSVRNIDK